MAPATPASSAQTKTKSKSKSKTKSQSKLSSSSTATATATATAAVATAKAATAAEDEQKDFTHAYAEDLRADIYTDVNANPKAKVHSTEWRKIMIGECSTRDATSDARRSADGTD